MEVTNKEQAIDIIKAFRESRKGNYDKLTQFMRGYLGKKLKEIRTYNQLTQNEFAKRLEVPTTTYANWEQGRRDPSIYDIINIMLEFQVTPNELFEWDLFE